MPKRVREIIICDHCDTDITGKINLRETHDSTFFLCRICASGHDLHYAENEETNNDTAN